MASMAFGDYPEQPKSIPWKLILIIVGGVLVAGGILVAVFFATRNSAPVTNTPASTVKTFGQQTSSQSNTQADPCAQAADSDACKVQQTKIQAVAEKKADTCDSLKDLNKDDCYWAVAIATGDVDVCTKISGPDLQTQCADELNASAAIQKPDVSLCDKIKDTQINVACQAIIKIFPKGNICDASVTDCFASHVLAVANQMNDSGVCRVLPPKKQAICVAGVTLDDPDHDGLDSTVERVMYGTDPYNADTDGDGYPDGAEVKSGHDPLKK